MLFGAPRFLWLWLQFHFVFFGLTYSLLAPEWFKAEVVMTQSGKKSLGSGISQLSGLVGLAGIDVADSDQKRPLAVLRSKAFARDFIEERDLAEEILESRVGPNGEIDVRDAVKFFDEKVRKVTEDKRSGLITLSVTWKDPKVAAEWANMLVARLNNRLQNEALAESQKNVTFLQREISGTSVIALQQSLGKVLEGEMQKLMMARGNDQFAFRIIDPAEPPKVRESPKRRQIVLISAFVGFFLSALTVLIRKSSSRGSIF